MWCSDNVVFRQCGVQTVWCSDSVVFRQCGVQTMWCSDNVVFFVFHFITLILCESFYEEIHKEKIYQCAA